MRYRVIFFLYSMRISELGGKNVLILGFGKEGQATLRAIEAFAPDARVTIGDKNAEPINRLIAQNSKKNPLKLKQGITTQSGNSWLRAIETFDVIIKSPGIPLSQELQPYGEKMTSAVQIFLDSIAESGAVVIGVTGSKGKSTTSSLIAAILKAGGKDVHLVGNIGEPSIAHIGDARPGTIFVHELSSYMLMDLTRSPHIAVVTSFFPEHLDYHGSLEAYRDAKSHIARFQGRQDAVFFCAESEGAKVIASAGNGRKIPFSSKDAPLKIEETHLIGEHNLSNIAGALAAAAEVGVGRDVAVAAVKDFHGLPHRLQDIGMHGGIRWVDDAISTTPESAIAALDALGDDVITIILGGQDRGVDFAALGTRIKNSNILTVILFPGSGPRIREAIGNAHADVCFHEVDSMEKAIAQALKNTMPGKICLLSTASPSYGMFKNFEEKGDQFQNEIAAQCV